DDEAALLRVGRDRAARAGGGEPAVPRPLPLGRFPAEVIGDRDADARMPQVPGDEAVSAPRARPQRAVYARHRESMLYGETLNAHRPSLAVAAAARRRDGARPRVVFGRARRRQSADGASDAGLARVDSPRRACTRAAAAAAAAGRR